jgi:hypothetical protein
MKKDEACYSWDGREKHTGFWLENLKKGNYLEYANIDGRITVKIS